MKLPDCDPCKLFLTKTLAKNLPLNLDLIVVKILHKIVVRSCARFVIYFLGVK